jgi:hypothetical protein
MFEKIVRRVPVSALDTETDLIGLIDLIEIELGLSTGEKSVRNRLLAVVSEIRQSEGVASEENIAVFLDVIERIGMIERYLLDSGFETARDTSDG